MRLFISVNRTLISYSLSSSVQKLANVIRMTCYGRVCEQRVDAGFCSPAYMMGLLDRQNSHVERILRDFVGATCSCTCALRFTVRIVSSHEWLSQRIPFDAQGLRHITASTATLALTIPG